MLILSLPFRSIHLIFAHISVLCVAFNVFGGYFSYFPPFLSLILCDILCDVVSHTAVRCSAVARYDSSNGSQLTIENTFSTLQEQFLMQKNDLNLKVFRYLVQRHASTHAMRCRSTCSGKHTQYTLYATRALLIKCRR